MSKIDYTLWPNPDGNLGNNKVEIPDGVNTLWPTGDALVGNFIYKDGKLVGFVDNKALINNDSKTSNIPYDYFEIHLENFSEGDIAFNLGERCQNFIVTYGSTNSGDTVTFKYKGCTTVEEVKAVDPDYLTTDIVDGVWTERLDDLNNGYKMFYDSELSEFNSDLSSLTNGEEMFYYCNKLTQFNTDLPKLENGESMFYYCNKLTQFNTDLPKLENGKYMFALCALAEFNSDLSMLVETQGMFSQCKKLTTFDAPMISLVNADNMFNAELNYCETLSSFKSDLPNLESGAYMFKACDALTTFDAPMPKLTTPLQMVFADLNKYDDNYKPTSKLTTFKSDLSSITQAGYTFGLCEKLTSFDAKMTSLTNGERMFYGCRALTAFNSDLNSLTEGYGMFCMCKLDTASIQNIADTINTPTSKGTIHIGIGKDEPNEQEETAFNTIASRNWIVYVDTPGEDSSEWIPTATTPIDGEQTITPIPYWAKPVPTTEEHAYYIDSDGNYYNVLGGQFIYGDNLETYGMFTSHEDAVANMRLTKYERTEKEETI